jgi:hypothetical protein
MAELQRRPQSTLRGTMGTSGVTSPLATVILCALELLPAQEDRPGGTVSHESIDSGGSHPSGEIPTAGVTVTSDHRRRASATSRAGGS